MKTYEMVAQADKNGLTYRTANMYYTKGKGFHDSEEKEWDVIAWDLKNGLDRFIHEDGWEPILDFQDILVCFKPCQNNDQGNLMIYLDTLCKYVLPMSKTEAKRFILLIKALVEKDCSDIKISYEV